MSQYCNIGHNQRTRTPRSVSYWYWVPPQIHTQLNATVFVFTRTTLTGNGLEAGRAHMVHDHTMASVTN